MAEQIGLIVKAGGELKKDESGMVFKMGVDKFTYSLFDSKLQAFAKENLGKRVKVIYNKSADGKYRNVEDIQLTYEPSNDETREAPAYPKKQWGRAPEEIASIETQVAAKVTADLLMAGVLAFDSPEGLGLRTWVQTHLPIDEKLLATGARAKMVAELAEQEATGQIARRAPDKPIDTPRRSIKEEVDAIVAEPLSEEQTAKLRLGLFKAECKRHGWDWQTKEGGDAIAAWLDRCLGGLRWNQMTAEAQEAKISELKQMAGEKEDVS